MTLPPKIVSSNCSVTSPTFNPASSTIRRASASPRPSISGTVAGCGPWEMATVTVEFIGTGVPGAGETSATAPTGTSEEYTDSPVSTPKVRSSARAR